MAKYPCYKAVQRPILFGGVSSKVIAVELLSALILLKVAGAEWWLSAVYLVILHKFLSWLFKKDHLIMSKLNVYFFQPDALHPGRTRNLPIGFGRIR